MALSPVRKIKDKTRSRRAKTLPDTLERIGDAIYDQLHQYGPDCIDCGKHLVFVPTKAGRVVIPNPDCSVAARYGNRPDSMGIATQLMLQNPETLVTPICPTRGASPAISRNSADTG